MRIATPIRGLLVWSMLAGAAAACGGSTTETSNPGGGSIVDSALPDAQDEGTAPEAGVDAEADTAQPDASIDQAVEDTSAPDVEVAEGSLFDLTMPDVALNDSGATVQTCYDCAATQCSSEMASCEADDTCRTLVLCLFTDGCIDGSGQAGVDYNCALGCASQAGVSNPMDPAVQIAFSVASCANDTCQAECALPDGGVIPPADGGN